MFGRKPQIDITQIMPTSKMALKISCLNACKNDIAEAERLYDYFTKDIGELPDFEPVRPTVIQQVKQGADELFGWLNAHGEDIAKGWSMIQSLRGVTTPTAPPADVPPIPID
ncbi:MAG: hypothetical protein IIW52_05360 [Alistipes sp.]|nr:hypothetical protein [Alistipes sp.]